MEWKNIGEAFSTLWTVVSSIALGTQPSIKTDIWMCDTPACYASAKYLEASMDPTVDPCDNFYQYACGRWDQNQFKEKEALSTIHDRILRNSKENLDFLKLSNNKDDPTCVRSVRKLFASCLDTDAIDRGGIKPLKDALERVYIPANPFTRVPSINNFDFLLTTFEMQRSLGIEMFYSIGILGKNPYDVADSCISILRPAIFYPPLPTVPTPPITDIGKTSQYNYSTAKQKYVNLTLSLLCKDSAEELCNLKNFTMTAYDRLETYSEELNKIKLTPSYSDKYQYKRVIYSLEKLQRLTDELADEMKATPIDWTRNLKLAFSDSNVRIGKHVEILIEESYIKNILRFIYSYSSTDHEIGAWWAVVDSLAEYSISPLRTAKRNIINTFVGYENREEWCEKIMNRLYGPVVSYRYNLDASQYWTKFKVTEMFRIIQDVFVNSVYMSTWMDEKTRIKAVNKILSEIAFVSFPDTDISPEYTIGKDLDSYFRNCAVTGNFLESVLLRIMDDSLFALHLRNAKNIDVETRNKFLLLYPPVTVNAFYLERFNSLVIPAGLLGFPLYGNGGLEALNYGSIGTVIGHEMMHGLDISGRLLDIQGQVGNWWTSESLQKYHELADCLITAYDKLKINGFHTLSENMADNVGFRQAFLAYRAYVARNGPEPKLPNFEHMTHEQLFTLSYANVFCEAETVTPASPDHFSPHTVNSGRVLGVLTNSAEFHRIWNCAAGTRMNNTDKKCKIW